MTPSGAILHIAFTFTMAIVMVTWQRPTATAAAIGGTIAGNALLLAITTAP